MHRLTSTGGFTLTGSLLITSKLYPDIRLPDHDFNDGFKLVIKGILVRRAKSSAPKYISDSMGRKRVNTTEKEGTFYLVVSPNRWGGEEVLSSPSLSTF